MKNKLIVLFILSIAVVLSITSYVIGNNDTSTSKIRDSGVQNNLIIEKIANDIISSGTSIGDEEVTITLRTEWNGLYLEPATGVTSGAMVGELEKTITKDIILANLIPQVDEESYSEDITYAPTTSTTQAWQYALTTGSSYKYAKPINDFLFVADPATDIDDNGKVYEAFTTSSAYEFVVVNDKNINPATTINDFKTLLTNKGVTSSAIATVSFDSTTSTSAITTLNSALTTLKNSPNTNTKKVILLIADKEIATDVSATKLNFIDTFSNQLIASNITLFSSSILSNSTTFTENPYSRTSKDRLGNTTGTYTYDSSKLYPQEIKSKLAGLMFDYDSGTSQINLLNDLKNLVGLESYYQRWHIKFTNSMVDHNKWKKILFSLNDFNLVYSATGTTPELITEVKTTTVLKKPIADAGIYFSPGTSSEILSVNPSEKYYDRYYFTNSPVMIVFTNPDEKVQKPFWNPSNVSSPVYRLEFEVFKFGATETIPNGAKLDSLSVLVKNKENTVLNLEKVDISNYKATKGRIPVSIEFTNDQLDKIRSAIKVNDNINGIESRYYYLTFEVIAVYREEVIKRDITARVDLLPPEVLGATYAQNSEAAKILKALDIFEEYTDEVEDEYIRILTSVDGAENLYIRKDLSDPTPFILFNFILYDENFKTNSDGTFNLDYYKNVIHSSIASNFIGQHVVTVYDVNESESQIEVTISGELKEGTLLRSITIKDGFGNEATIEVVNAKLVYLDDPVSIPVNLVNSQVNSPPHIGGNTFTFVKAKNNGIDINNYDLKYDLINPSNNHIVGLILPFTQDIDTYRNGYKNLTDTLSYFGNKISTENLSYKVYKAAQSYPLEMGGTVSGYNSSINLLSRNGGIKYDGIYGIENILPVNRAGGIAGFVYDLSDTQTRDSNVAKLTSPITSKQYVVDTIMPQKLKVHKTAVAFKDGSTIYTNNEDFIVPFVSMQIDSSYPTVTYSDSIFTGNVADKNLDGKPLDIYTVQLDDFSLGLVNTNPGNLSADTSTNANTRFYTYKISNNANFTAEDLANNDNPYAGNIGNLITLYPGVNSVSYGINVKEPEDLLNNNFYFTNLMDELLSHNSFAGAASSKLITGAIGTVSKDYNLTIPTVIFDTNGEKFITTYSFTSAGWVKSELKSIVYDTEINTTNKTLPQAVLIKTGMNTWEGEINFGDIYEYAGLSNFTISGGRASNISIGDNSFTVNSSNIIMRTETAALDRSNATKKVTFTYNTSSKIPTDTVKVTLTDKLGNTGEFNLKLLISNPLYLLGTSANSNKQIKSTVDINSNRKIIIKGVTEENK